MKRIKKSAFVTAILLLISVGVFSQTSDTKSAKIKTLLELTGSAKLGTQIMNQLIASLQAGNSKAPEGFWEAFRQEINDETLINKIVPIYAKHYTEEDINGLIAFYQSDLGKKVITSLPVVMQESMQVGQEWGKEISEKALKKLKEQESGN